MPRMNRFLVRAAIAGALVATAPALALAQTSAPALPEGTIPAGVSIAGVDVSGLAALDARQRLYDQLVTPRRAPMPVTFDARTFTIDPDAIGYKADVDGAIVAAFQQAPAPGTTGLYHVAFLYPSRAELADALQRVLRAGLRLDGAADHGVSEALYLRDPDGNGVELYRDRPEAQWPRTPEGGLAMYSRALNLEALLHEAPEGS